MRPDREDRIAELREGAVGSELVRRHFDDPDSAWKEAMEIDDGGVTRLAGALAEVCVPSVKLAQIEDQLDIQVRHLLRRLVSYYESSDIDTRLAEKREAAGRLVDALDNCFDRNRWGGVDGGADGRSGTHRRRDRPRPGRYPTLSPMRKPLVPGGPLRAATPLRVPVRAARAPAAASRPLRSARHR